MAYKILIADKKLWEKDCKKLPQNERKKIEKKIMALKDFPNQCDIKKLSHFEVADYRLRIGDYRVLFDIDHDSKVILLYRVLNRSHSYKI